MTKKLYKYIAPFVIVGLLFLVLPKTAEAAIAFDAASNANNINITSLTWSHTTTGTNLLLVVGTFAKDGTDADRPVSDVTYGGVSLTKVREDDDTTINHTSGLWYLVNPATGANDVVVSFAGGTLQVGIAGAMTFTGVKQTSPLDASNGGVQANAASISTTVTTVSDNAMVAASVNKVGSSPTSNDAGAGITERWDVDVTEASGNVSSGGHAGPKSPAGDQAMSWSQSVGTTHDWAISAASFAPASEGAAATEPSSLVIQKGAVFIEKGQMVIQ